MCEFTLRMIGNRKRKKPSGGGIPKGFRGADGSRNHDLFDANEALYQLSYSPLGVVLLRRTTQFTVVRPPPKCKTASQCTCVECVSDGEYQRRSIGGMCQRVHSAAALPLPQHHILVELAAQLPPIRQICAHAALKTGTVAVLP